MLSVELDARFLFTMCVHTIRRTTGARPCSARCASAWFAQSVLLDNPPHLCEYPLQCPSAKVRSAFVKILVFLPHDTLNDGPCSEAVNNSAQTQYDGRLADRIFYIVLGLLSKEVADYGRHVSQCFNFFLAYVLMGPAEKAHLLRLNALVTSITVALDEGRVSVRKGHSIKYQYAELGGLYRVMLF